MKSPAAFAFLLIVSVPAAMVACGEPSTTPLGPNADAGLRSVTADAGGASSVSSEAAGDAATAVSTLPRDRFVTNVVSFTPGPCAGFGADTMPDVVLGPPRGAGAMQGSLDVVSLGIGGEIVVSFEPGAIVDGPGPDFIVFENAFFAAGNPDQPAADPGEVSVSEDGLTWQSFPCPPQAQAPFGACAGWHPVYSNPANSVSPIDPSSAGGEAYDLADLGVSGARFIRIRDRSSATCDGRPKPNNLGFDLDAIAIVNAAPSKP